MNTITVHTAAFSATWRTTPRLVKRFLKLVGWFLIHREAEVQADYEI